MASMVYWNMITERIALIEALLNDDHGISEKAYNALVEYLENGINWNYPDEECDSEETTSLLIRVQQAEATDGRFYFPYHGEQE